MVNTLSWLENLEKSGSMYWFGRAHDRTPQGNGADTCTPGLWASSWSDFGSHRLSCWSTLCSELQAKELVTLGFSIDIWAVPCGW
jgi:hypothetical protein